MEDLYDAYFEELRGSQVCVGQLHVSTFRLQQIKFKERVFWTFAIQLPSVMDASHNMGDMGILPADTNPGTCKVQNFHDKDNWMIKTYTKTW